MSIYYMFSSMGLCDESSKESVTAKPNEIDPELKYSIMAEVTRKVLYIWGVNTWIFFRWRMSDPIRDRMHTAKIITSLAYLYPCKVFKDIIWVINFQNVLMFQKLPISAISCPVFQSLHS